MLSYVLSWLIGPQELRVKFRVEYHKLLTTVVLERQLASETGVGFDKMQTARTQPQTL